MARSKVPHHDPAALPDDVEARDPLAEQPGPRSLLEFQQLFASEEQCAEYLRNIRWPAGFVCPKCGSRTGYTLATRRVTECRNGHPVSLTAGTGPHRSNLLLTLWFHAAYLNEFTFRFNRRYWRSPAFHRALGLMVHAATWPEYGTLYGMAKGDNGAWVHPTSPANASPKLKPDADTTVTLPVGAS